MLCTRHLLHVPRLLVLDHGIENRQELAYTGRSATFATLPAVRRRSSNLLRTGLYRTATSVLRYKVARTWARPPKSCGSPAGCHSPDYRERRRRGPRCAGGFRCPPLAGRGPASATPWPHPWDTAVQGRARARRGSPAAWVQVVIQGRHALLEPGNMGRDVGPQATRRVFTAVLFGGPHRHELPPPRQEGAQLSSLRVRKRTRRRSPSLGKVDHGTGIEDIGCGELPSCVAKSPPGGD